ncbi:hypothetical protein OHC33_001438 [Knufia fluminis]|uniref:Protein YOP1 n=1 Tax=Knufia fluminis TaxID=191047 RepID=A0AAN8EJJ2_9EURO|nr:hypothetical protein OHC33_001438 [Knufia fluminis]
MFGIIADLISSVTTILLPCYLSYKSLRLGDPAQTTPWLIYFIILTLTLLAESWTLFIIGWMPFYSWFRLFFLLYLVLPQTQGAKHLYLTYFEPFIVHHETQIDDFIGQAHQRLEQMGLGYMNIVVEWIREKILGQTSPQAQGVRAASAIPPGAQGYASYATDLLSRFAMPAARTSAAPSMTAGGAGGMLNMLSSAAGAALSAGAASGTSRSVPASAQAASLPDTFLSNLGSMSSDQKSSFISTQRDRLNAMLRALDKEQQTLDLAYGESKIASASGRRPPSSQGGEFTKSRSQMSFDNIDYDDLNSSSGGNGSGYPSQHSTPPTMRQTSGQGKRTTSGNWVTGGLGGWLGGSPREDTRDRDDRDDRGYREERRSPRVSGGGGDDDYPSRGYTSARDITETIARSARDYTGDRDRDRDYR